MVDIVPAIALRQVAKRTEKKASAPENLPTATLPLEKKFSSSPLKQEPGKKGLVLIILIIVFAVISAVIILLNWSKITEIFTGKNLNQKNQAAYQNIDEDQDGLTTLEELAAGTLANDVDTDKDGIPDGFEARNGLNPLNQSDSVADLDEDGLNNLAEFQLGTKINEADTDKDGYKDGDEVKKGFDPNGAGSLSEASKQKITSLSQKKTIEITGKNFEPALLRIKKGESIVFVNKDRVNHSIVGAEIESEIIAPGKEFIFIFKNTGTFDFYDRYNTSYRGKVIVD